MSDILTIALLQFDVAWLDVQKNLQKIQTMCSSINNKVDIIFLPEMFATGFTIAPELLDIKNQSLVLNKIMALSDKLQTVITGSYPYFDEGKFYNRLLFISPDSKVEYYNKRHLFSIGEENLKYHSGSERKVFELKGWKIMPQICYDLRFPVWSRNTMKYDLLFYSSNWPAARDLAWETLLKARAIENQCYVVGINRIGTDGRNISYIGNSQIISANGKVISVMGNKEHIYVNTLLKNELNEYRQSFPVLDDIDSFQFDINEEAV
jgi:omega-amidase